MTSQRIENKCVRNTKEKYLILGFLLSIPLVLLMIWSGTKRWSEESIQESLTQAAKSLDARHLIAASDFDIETAQLKGVPIIMAADSRLIRALLHSSDPKSLSIANEYLKNVSKQLVIDFSILIDPNGLCVASNNFDTAENLVGTAYPDRKYFKEAKTGRLGFQFAVGRKTNISGLFFSSPVRDETGTIIGVVAIKANTPNMIRRIRLTNGFITDEQGVVILSNKDKLLFKAVPNAPILKASVDFKQKLYKRSEFPLLDIVPTDLARYHDAVFFEKESTPALIRMNQLSQDGFSMYLIEPLSHIEDIEKQQRFLFVFFSLMSLVSLWALCATILSVLRNRMYHKSLLEANRSIEEANQQLNETVRQQTAELSAANAQLKDELAERDQLMEAIEQSGETVMITDPMGNIQYVNRNFEQETGYTRTDIYGKNPRILKSGIQEDAFYRQLWSVISTGETFHGRLVNKRKDGTLYTEAVTISPVLDASGKIVAYVAVKRNITTYLQLQEQLAQTLKMESVGRLAGGVAHDFNNMLSVILGYTEIVLDKIDSSDPIHDDLQQIFDAAKRSAEITQQLLAFARKQTIAPRKLNLNETLEGMLRMLRRLIGEDVNLVWSPKTELKEIWLDPSQLNQILANLCINSRDAITGVGKITIETGMTTFDEEYCADHAGFHPGDFVFLAVSDDGCGMDKTTLEKIFEPFFTTKEEGHGTGLGLSTVYGIVKQNDGFINVYSEPGHGTTFKIYFPAFVGSVEVTPVIAAESSLGHGETILIVEDELPVLNLSKTMLTKLGYSVLTANSPEDAIQLAETHAGNIDMLLTDVVMPEMNGRELAGKLHDLYPNMKILFMSGYTANVIAHRGTLDEGVQLLNKPFSTREIAAKIHEVLKHR